jgi:hypothetical protein
MNIFSGEGLGAKRSSIKYKLDIKGELSENE